MPTPGIFEVVKKGKGLGLAWVQKKRQDLEKVQVKIDPMGMGTIKIVFSCPPDGCGLSEEQKGLIKGFLWNEFKEDIAPSLRKLGWKDFRIRTCSRNKSAVEYCWYIEDRTKR